MLKKSLFSFLLFCTASYASTCPEPMDIRAQTLYGWKAYNIESGDPVSPEVYAQFAKKIEVFALTEWIGDINPSENLSHCYYHGKTKDDDYLGVYLAKQKIRPDKASHGWKGWGTSYMRCEGNLYECRFVEQ